MAIYVPSDIRQATQKQQALWYLKRYKSMTSLDAIDTFTMTRLAAIVGFLEDDGYTFRHASESGHTRYHLIGGPGIDNGQLGLGLGAPR